MAHRKIEFVPIGALMATAPLCQAAVPQQTDRASHAPAADPGTKGDGTRLRLAASSQPAFPPSARAIREAQGLMAALGYTPGPADGVWGPRTAKAYAAFLRDARLPPGRVLTPDALRAMRGIAGKGKAPRAASKAGSRIVSGARGPSTEARREAKDAAPTRTAESALPSCSAWNTRDFFKAATVERVTECIRAGADPNATDDREMTPLRWAIASNANPAVIAGLIGGGADPNARDKNEQTPLHWAARKGNPAVVGALLKGGAKPNVRDKNRFTPLHAAARSNESPAVIGVLLKAGADLKARGNFGGTPLHRAVSNRNLSLMRALLEAGADPNATERTPSAKGKGGARPLHKAAYREDPAFVTALIEAGADPSARDSFGNTPLHNAIGNKNPATVAALLKGGGDPNARGQLGKTPLDRAIKARNRAVAELLLKAGDTARAGGETGTDLSARAKSRDSAARGASASRSTRVASSWTGKCESWPSAGWFRAATPAMVRKCLRAGAHPNHWDNTGYRPLHETARWNKDPAVIEVLLRAGADANAWDGSGFRSLHGAAMSNDNPAVTVVLLKAGADTKVRDKAGNTPLHHAAASNKNPAVAAALLKAGAEPNARDKLGKTPLHRAAGSNRDPAIAAALIEGGADPNARDDTGKTPMDEARYRYSSAVVAALLAAGAEDRQAAKIFLRRLEFAVLVRPRHGRKGSRMPQHGGQPEEAVQAGLHGPACGGVEHGRRCRHCIAQGGRGPECAGRGP